MNSSFPNPFFTNFGNTLFFFTERPMNAPNWPGWVRHANCLTNLPIFCLFKEIICLNLFLSWKFKDSHLINKIWKKKKKKSIWEWGVRGVLSLGIVVKRCHIKSISIKKTLILLYFTIPKIHFIIIPYHFTIPPASQNSIFIKILFF